ncbi:MAG: hypothetical protein D4R65_03085 [Verrucomicrobiaceae bacterium]|nr:MAG: hypothetical protein D4R65_03085 [Verrucomicrobiaceae bacterium]
MDLIMGSICPSRVHFTNRKQPRPLLSGLLEASRFPDRFDAQGMSSISFKRDDGAWDFQDRMSESLESETTECACEHLGLNDPGMVAETEKFHRLPVVLLVETIRNHRPANRHPPTGMTGELPDRTIRLPGNIRPQFERVSGDSEPK